MLDLASIPSLQEGSPRSRRSLQRLDREAHANRQSQLFRGLPGDLMHQIRDARAQIDRSTLQQMIIVDEALTEWAKVFSPSELVAKNLMTSKEEELAGLFGLTEQQEDAIFSSANQLAKKTASRLGQLPCSLPAGRRVQPLRASRQKVHERAREGLKDENTENIPPARPKKAQHRPSPFSFAVPCGVKDPAIKCVCCTKSVLSASLPWRTQPFTRNQSEELATAIRGALAMLGDLSATSTDHSFRQFATQPHPRAKGETAIASLLAWLHNGSSRNCGSCGGVHEGPVEYERIRTKVAQCYRQVRNEHLCWICWTPHGANGIKRHFKKCIADWFDSRKAKGLQSAEERQHIGPGPAPWQSASVFTCAFRCCWVEGTDKELQSPRIKVHPIVGKLPGIHLTAEQSRSHMIGHVHSGGSEGEFKIFLAPTGADKWLAATGKKKREMKQKREKSEICS